MTLKIGYIGLGALGRHLAGSLLRAGFPLTVYDVDASCSVDLGKAGATCAASIADTARASDTIITCLPSPEAVASVVVEEGGVFETLAPGGTWIDMSTTDPHDLLRLSEVAPAQRHRGARGPVTGGVHRAAAGDDHGARRRRQGTFKGAATPSTPWADESSTSARSARPR